MVFPNFWNQGRVVIVIVLTTDRGSISATYRGGEYIDIRYGENEYPEEVINVFDYGADEPYIENTTEKVREALIEWLKARNPELTIYSVFESDSAW